ncbi:MAG: amino acid permease [Planctomycetes bacterium]|nr:amino acid permease [Planctomycetota bacterium]
MPRRSRDGSGGRGHGFGTFAGVFTPCVLTIFGVIMFLRAGYVVGNAGVGGALLILLVAKSISLLTTLSLSAIATNQKVEGGGAYFLISRSLGGEFGGSIGVALFLAQAVSVALYVAGFTEAVCSTFPWLAASSRVVSAVVCTVLLIVAYVGASWAIRVQFIVLAVLGISIASFFIGPLPGAEFDSLRERLSANWSSGYEGGATFWLVFAIYFPAATGIMAGASMSGDLANPRRSLPRGTLLAVSVTGVVYALQMLLLGAFCDRADLLGDSLILKRLSLWAPLVDAGIWAATLSSALGSFVGAPRVLQALGRDGIFPGLGLLARGFGPAGEPRRATIATFFIAMGCLLAADLNVIAPVITMFFLITYGMVNFACFYESRARNPSFRPTFRLYHWSTALLAAIACLVVMFLINRAAAAAALLVLLVLHFYVKKRRVLSTWGDARIGFFFRRAVDDLVALEHMEYHPKNWRPQILVLSGNPKTRPGLVELATFLESGRGLLMVGNVLSGDVDQLIAQRKPQEDTIRAHLDEARVEGFAKVVVARSFEDGFLSLVQSAGVGRLRPNCVLFGWCEERDSYAGYARCLRRAVQLGHDVLIFRQQAERSPLPRRIDIWWRGRENGSLMVLLAYLLSLNDEWRGVRLRILRIIANRAGEDEALAHLRALLEEARVRGEARVVVAPERVREVIARESESADLVFLGMDVPPEGEEKAFLSRLDELTRPLRAAVLVKSTGHSDIIA